MTGLWFTARELAEMELPGLPATRRGVNKQATREAWSSRDRRGRGGGREYHYTVLPEAARAEIIRQTQPEAADLVPPATMRAEQPKVAPDMDSETRWGAFDAMSDTFKEEARRRLNAILRVEAVQGEGVGRCKAIEAAAADFVASPASIRRWFSMIRGAPREDWLPMLAPRWAGRPPEAECSPEAWEFFKSDYLRLERPAASEVYYRLSLAAGEHGWTVPCLKTLVRRLEREVAPLAVIYARQGAAALDRAMPAQTRDRSDLRALEAVCADGHKFDVFVRWPDGEIGRPIMIAWQDLYSNKLLSWRIDKTENAAVARLAFGDMVDRYGIPERALMDNGMAFAAKTMTGGAKTRFRFKIKHEEPEGLLKALGVGVHWATPARGQVKPIERSFKDLCESIARHPACAGAYCGNDPTKKPENYGSRAIPLEDFLAHVTQGIRQHNARGRSGGRSFDETFAASYETAPIRKASEAQKKLWLLAAEQVLCRKPAGEIHLMGNSYWCEKLVQHIGTRVVVRFDPQNLHAPMHVYTAGGGYVGAADCKLPTGFFDQNAAQDHSRKKRAIAKKTREIAKIAKSLTPAQVAGQIPGIGDPTIPDSKVVRPIFDTAEKPDLARTPEPTEADEADKRFGAMILAMGERFKKTI